MKNRFSLTCFDMDGTLIRNTNSVEYLCNLNDTYKQFMKIEEMEDEEKITWIEGDHMKARLVKGLHMDNITTYFDQKIELISNLDLVLNYLRKISVRAILITSGPVQVAKILEGKYGFDKVFGSKWEVSDGCFTGKILKHLGEEGKLACLKSYCKSNNINFDDCIAVGDSSSDIEIFKYVGKSIAINYSDTLIGNASEYIMTEDLMDIIPLLKSY